MQRPKIRRIMYLINLSGDIWGSWVKNAHWKKRAVVWFSENATVVWFRTIPEKDLCGVPKGPLNKYICFWKTYVFAKPYILLVAHLEHVCVPKGPLNKYICFWKTYVFGKTYILLVAHLEHVCVPKGDCPKSHYSRALTIVFFSCANVFGAL